MNMFYLPYSGVDFLKICYVNDQKDFSSRDIETHLGNITAIFAHVFIDIFN